MTMMSRLCLLLLSLILLVLSGCHLLAPGAQRCATDTDCEGASAVCVDTVCVAQAPGEGEGEGEGEPLCPTVDDGEIAVECEGTCGAATTPNPPVNGVICTVGELQQMLVGGESSNFQLGRSLDLSGIRLTPPATFGGTFDGLGRTLRGLRLDGPADVALFGQNLGAISNLTIEDAAVTGGGLVGALCTRCGSLDNVRLVRVRVWSAGGSAGAAGGTMEGPVASGLVAIDVVVVGDVSGGLFGELQSGTLSSSMVRQGLVRGTTGVRGVAGGVIGQLNDVAAEVRETVVHDVVVDAVSVAGGVIGVVIPTVINVSEIAVNEITTTQAAIQGAAFGQFSPSAPSFGPFVITQVRGARRFVGNDADVEFQPNVVRTSADLDDAATTSLTVLSTIADTLPEFGRDTWLFPLGLPPTIASVPSPTCGNGVVDPGEACDPGSTLLPATQPSHCSDTCRVIDAGMCGGRISACVPRPTETTAFDVVGDDPLQPDRISVITESRCPVLSTDQGHYVILGAGPEGARRPDITCPLALSGGQTVDLIGVTYAITGCGSDCSTALNGADVHLADSAIFNDSNQTTFTGQAGTVSVDASLVSNPEGAFFSVSGRGQCTTRHTRFKGTLGSCSGEFTTEVNAGVVRTFDGAGRASTPPADAYDAEARPRSLGTRGAHSFTRSGAPGVITDVGAYDTQLRLRGTRGVFASGADILQVALLDGLGTPAEMVVAGDPFQAHDDIDLAFFREVAGEDAPVIVLQGDRRWPDALGALPDFAGVFDGAGFALTNLRSSLVGALAGVVRDLDLVQPHIDCPTGTCNLGFVAATLEGTSAQPARVQGVHILDGVLDGSGNGAGGVANACTHARITDVVVDAEIRAGAVGGIINNGFEGCVLRRVQVSGDSHLRARNNVAGIANRLATDGFCLQVGTPDNPVDIECVDVGTHQAAGAIGFFADGHLAEVEVVAEFIGVTTDTSGRLLRTVGRTTDKPSISRALVRVTPDDAVGVVATNGGSQQASPAFLDLTNVHVVTEQPTALGEYAGIVGDIRLDATESLPGGFSPEVWSIQGGKLTLGPVLRCPDDL